MLSANHNEKIFFFKTTWTKNNLQVHSHLLLSEERHPRKSEVMSVYKHILDKQVWWAAMLLKQTQNWFIKQVWWTAVQFSRNENWLSFVHKSKGNDTHFFFYGHSTQLNGKRGENGKQSNSSFKEGRQQTKHYWIWKALEILSPQVIWLKEFWLKNQGNKHQIISWNKQ